MYEGARLYTDDKTAVNNRIAPFISGLPKQYHLSLLSFLRDQPGFRDLKLKMHLNSADGGATVMPGAISASISVSYLQYSSTYRDYSVKVLAVLNDIFIICEKI